MPKHLEMSRVSQVKLKGIFFLNFPSSGIFWHVESEGCRLDPQTTVTVRDRGLGVGRCCSGEGCGALDHQTSSLVQEF